MTAGRKEAPLGAFTLEAAQAFAARTGETVTPTFCGMCGPSHSCGVYAFARDGRFTRVAGMRESPVNKGTLCAKAHAAPQWVYSPDRLTRPLKRIGRRGEGRFEPISWDEALGIVADTLARQKQQYGPESLAVLAPAFRSYNEYLRRFLTAHGSPNYGHSGICAIQRAFCFFHTLGDWPGADIEKSDVVLYWGRQPIYSGAALEAGRALVRARERGAKIIAIKPSVEPDVGLADVWVPVRPGTDAALALAMLHVVVTEGLIDAAFVEKWCFGYDRLQEHVKQYPPGWAEEITGVPAEQIVEVARLYATTPLASIDLGNGVEHAPSASDAIRAVAILIAITGHLDRPGGNLFGTRAGVPTAMPQPKPLGLRERFTQEMIDKLVGPEFPRPFQPFLEGLSSAYYRIFDSILTGKPYPIRTVFAPGTQPAVSTRGSRHVLEALEKVDFYVVADVSRTADMAWADLVFPLATPYETDHPFEARNGWVMARRRVVEPLGECRSMYQLILDLAVRMGYGEDFWGGSMTASMNDQLTPFAMTIDELRARPTGVLYKPLPQTYENYKQFFGRKSFRLSQAPFLPHGKVEIYNTSFEEAGYSPLPQWRPPPESAAETLALAERYPLVLSDYHTSKGYTASWQRNLPSLRELDPEPTLHVHPEAAASRGIANGDWVIVESPHGWLKVRAELFEGIRPDTVMMLHGWWQGCRELGLGDYPLLDGGANVNLLYGVDPDKAYDPLITAMSSQTLVEIRKAG